MAARLQPAAINRRGGEGFLGRVALSQRVQPRAGLVEGFLQITERLRFALD
jgi:hypothetical protein